MKLASIPDLKIFLDKTDSEADLLLAMIIEASSASFEGYTNRWFQKMSRTQYFDSGGTILQLRAFPIDMTVATVVTIDNDIQVSDDDYYVSPDKGYIEFQTSTVKGEPREISVSYTGGYEWTSGSGRLDVPIDLMFACLLQAALVFRNRRNLGVVSITLPDGSVNVSSQNEFLPQVVTVLDRYRI
jgi:hypothetical protein